MPREALHRFEEGGRRFAVDPETCFCFECDDVSWDVLAYYPQASVQRVLHDLGDRYERKELEEVLGELEWLRSTKAILPAMTADKFAKAFQVERGVRRITVRLPNETQQVEERRRGWFGGATKTFSNPARELGRDAVALLLSRSLEQRQLTLAFQTTPQALNPDLVADLCDYAIRMGRLSGKELTATLHLTDVALDGAPEALNGHDVSVQLDVSDPEALARHLRPLASGDRFSLTRLAKAIQPDAPGVTGRVVVCPGHASFADVVPALHEAGFRVIELDLDGAFIAHPDLDPAAVMAAQRECAVYFAKCLLARRYFRLDPITALFYRIHEGKPIARIDGAGTNELAVDADGVVYPSWRLIGAPEFALGQVRDGRIDEDQVRRFEDVGALTTAPCMTCWARNLCGGGCVAVHHALSGSFRRPHAAWCDAQRSWMSAAVSAFNLLSAQGVDFSPIYAQLSGKRGGGLRLSLWSMARAALQMTVSMRPLEESDAEMLVRWENWNDAGYFTFNPRGVLIATVYDREMDALHPQSLDQEMVLTRRDGAPIGLVRIGPDMQHAGLVHVSVFLRDPALYAAEDIRKGFRLLVQEAAKQQEFRRALAYAPDREPALQGFLEAIGFERAGAMREALYLHGDCHDVGVYALTFA